MNQPVDGDDTWRAPASAPAGDATAGYPDDETEPLEADDVADRAQPTDSFAAADAAAEADDDSPLAVLDTMARERDDYLDALRRLQADFENYRKRVRADTEMEVGRATEKIINRLLPILDTFEMALSHEVDPNASPLAKIHDQLLSALESEGLERLHPEGAPFDPAEADAVVHEAAEEGEDGPVVSAVLRAGYRWKGRVMRAAMVKVRA